jgi:hypothetical protein
MIQKYKSYDEDLRTDALKSAQLAMVAIHQFFSEKKSTTSKQFVSVLGDICEWHKKFRATKECHISVAEMDSWSSIL